MRCYMIINELIYHGSKGSDGGRNRLLLIIVIGIIVIVIINHV